MSGTPCPAAVWKLTEKDGVANGEAVLVCVVPGLTSPQQGGPSESVWFCAATGKHPGCEAECTTHLFLSPLQAEDRRKRSDGIQPALQWPAALGHDAMPQARVGSGSSSSPCTPALQRAALVQVWCEYRCGITAWHGEEGG